VERAYFARTEEVDLLEGLVVAVLRPTCKRAEIDPKETYKCPKRSLVILFDQFVSTKQNSLRNCYAERSGRFDIDRKFELGRPFDR
jgi:hypothetical protein